MDKSYGNKKRKYLHKDRNPNTRKFRYGWIQNHSNKHRCARHYTKSQLSLIKNDKEKLCDFRYPLISSKCHSFTHWDFKLYMPKMYPI
jgi:hypothetical protein